MLKRILWIVGGLVGLLLLTLFFAPMIFRAQIQERVLKEINAQLNAEVEVGQVSLSFLRHFPHASVGLENISIQNKAPFEGRTLLRADEILLEANLLSVIGGKSLTINRILIDRPEIDVVVLEDGRANWDLVMADTAAIQAPSETSGSEFVLELNGYEIRDGRIKYADATYPLDLMIRSFNHTGKGALGSVNYDLLTQTLAEGVDISYGGIAYLDSARIDADMDMNIEAGENIAVKLLDNLIRVNDLGLTCDGSVGLEGDAILLDLKVGTEEEASLKKLYSLVPGVFTEGYEGIDASGQVAFSGNISGTYLEDQYPGFEIQLGVRDGEIQYPGLPKKISNILIDARVDHPQGDLEGLGVNLSDFSLMLGENPISLKGTFQGMERLRMDAQWNARLNLADLAAVIPMDGNEMKGQFAIQGEAQGQYDEAAGTFPSVDAIMEMKEGLVKNAEYPDAALSNLSFQASLKNSRGQMAETVLQVPRFHFDLGGRSLDGSARVENLDDPAYEIQAAGSLDLAEVMKIYPIEGMDLSGLVEINDFNTRGKYSDIEAERYTELPTSGDVVIKDLIYQDVAYPQSLNLVNANVGFTPDKVNIRSANGTWGNTDFQANGYLDNYLAYALKPDQELTGALILNSNLIDANEWMETPDSDGTPAETSGGAGDESYGVIPVPKGVNLIVQAQAQEIRYQSYNLSGFNGVLSVADEQVRLEDVLFNFLGGRVGMSGSYNTQDISQPLFAFSLDISRLGFQEAFKNLLTVKSFAPIAQFIQGYFNTQLAISGTLDQNLMPVLENITSEGLFEILEGSIAQLPVLQQLGSRLQTDALQGLSLDDLKGKFSIQDGYVMVDPFTIQHNDLLLTFGGRQNISGKLDYDLLLDLPSGKIGSAASTAVSNALGTDWKAQERVEIALDVGGTFQNPELGGFTQGIASNIKSQAKEKLREEATGQLEKVLPGLLGKDSAKSSMPGIPLGKGDSTLINKDSLAVAVEKGKEEVKKKLEEELKNQIGEENKKKLEELKNQIKLPLGKKGKKNN